MVSGSANTGKAKEPRGLELLISEKGRKKERGERKNICEDFLWIFREKLREILVYGLTEIAPRFVEFTCMPLRNEDVKYYLLFIKKNKDKYILVFGFII